VIKLISKASNYGFISLKNINQTASQLKTSYERNNNKKGFYPQGLNN
tara:strand:+ start:433 stop:573 length:141 start_codon:yes stop_codon:yes gene_type:complete